MEVKACKEAGNKVDDTFRNIYCSQCRTAVIFPKLFCLLLGGLKQQSTVTRVLYLSSGLF